jgi:hypothetical protein
MTKKRDWRRYKDMWVRILEQRTGEGVHEWLQRICPTRGACAHGSQSEA